MGTGGGGEAVEAEENVVTLKRMQRPSVRLHQPYDEKPVNCMSRKQRVPIKKGVGLKKRRPVKTSLSKTRKNSVVSCSSDEKEKEIKDFDDDNVVIGTWRNLKSKARRKSIRPPISNNSVKSHENEVKENENFQLSSSGESENQEGNGEEKNLGSHDEIPRNFEYENSDLPNPVNLIYDNGNNRVSSDCDCDYVDVEERRRRRLRVGQDSNEMDGAVGQGEIDKDRDGVRIWLNRLGLGKYAMLFEVHEVDDEILPLLTLEDLKDMGIIPVGSRRKMYSSIQKLGKGFS